MYFGHVLEEVGQLIDGPIEYLSTFWNRIDVLVFIVQTVAFTLRCYTILQFAARRNGISTDEPPDDLQRLNQIQFDFQIYALILSAFRYVETLTYNSRSARNSNFRMPGSPTARPRISLADRHTPPQWRRSSSCCAR
jgi:hypothetical protein